ncbi:ABC transporter substrate-binding protein [Methylopila jiangsuensis]|uniref:ABC transporter substrate-binding protein n=1 Tax=Methylopila jiangsuensis TaxID=586230 RepID=A0A9W6N308_9HYPH|nr:extracellular solute-binding protein [Methylopila jiangsuensis]MDR6286004.1 peptide/nickel transport system substrate-binding protein [Methylopila jiangsuensis]GLK75761.1 ABC transporter substrate-binding protein [Methylopila jiangsuensis]
MIKPRRTRSGAVRGATPLRRAFGAALAIGALALAAPAAATPAHGIAMHGAPALPQDFISLPYARPDAPKGGRVTYGWLGGFDTLNPYAYRGVQAQGLRGAVYESLLARSFDEPFTLYGLVAESVETPDDRSWVTFRLNPRARFSDGEPITAEDVLFTFQLLKEHGHPSYRSNYRRVKAAAAEGERAVRFDLADSEDRELPLILGLMPVLPAHAIDPKTFEDTTLKPIVGSGPYVISALEPGRSLTLRRDPDYWGAELPVNRGLNNFDEIRYDYYRDSNTMFEAFKKGLIDVLPESDPIRWTTGYDFPAVRRGEVALDRFVSGRPWGMDGLVFNTRKPVFADVRVREALSLLFDYEWMDRNLYGGATERTRSYFEGSHLASTGRPADEKERALLAPFPGVVRDDVMAGTWRPGSTDGSGRDREQLRRALDLLAEAGWRVQNGELRRDGSGEPFRFEILVKEKEQERLALAYARGLERAGVRATVRLADSTQHFRRLQTYDFDMIQYKWLTSLSPGVEQKKYWSVAAADTPGERNYMGVKQPAVDAMIAALLSEREPADFESAVRALDRVLLSGFYVVPLFHPKEQWVARWTAVQRPETTPLYGPAPETWWRDAPAR